ncbi:MAG: beta-lactamase family protein, partial [Actinomycetota bacterium]|nr:beta-lactamase family protein [Actinomycetota bacterium]
MSVGKRVFALICVLALLPACAPGAPPTQTTTTTAGANKSDAVMRIVADTMAAKHLKAVIVRVTVDGKEVVTKAVGESMTGVPATTNMHFRNGAVAISYVATLLLKLVDEQKVSLDDKLAKFLPEIPHADRVTLGQLAQMTSGYVDYVIGNTKMNDAMYANPFRRWTTHDLLTYSTTKPLLYEPGTNWNYSHTNYVLLGLALEKATGEQMSKLLAD